MTQRLRIVYLIDSLCDSEGTTVMHVRRLSRLLNRHEFTSRVVAMCDEPGDSRGSGLTCPVDALGYKPGHPFAIVRARLRLQRLLRTQPCDVVTVYDRVARMTGLPVVHSVHRGICVVNTRDMGHGMTPDDLERLRRANEAAHRFVTTSSAVAARLMRQEKVFRDWIDIIPPATTIVPYPARTPESMQSAKHSFGLSQEQRVILLDDALGPATDRTCFLEAVKHLSPHHPHARFVLMGKGPLEIRNALTSEAQRMGIADHLLFVDDPGMRNTWMLAADAGITVSHYEGAADALLRFMAAGLPVVTTATGDNPETVHHGLTGYVVEPCEADALAMRLHLLLAGGDLAREFGDAARQSVEEEFSDELEAKRYSDYYRAIVWSQISDQ